MNTANLTAELMRDGGLDPDEIAALLQAALAEDLGETGDLTSLATIPADARLQAAYTARAPGVVCGLPVVAALAEPVGTFDAKMADGERVGAGQTVAVVEGPARDILAIERTSLNLLTHLSGVATATRAWVDAVAGTSTRIRDTRKTIPLMRSLKKYAVRCGGGVNHRIGLYDAILIKDNHVAATGGVGAALDGTYNLHPRGSLVVQVEVDSLPQLHEALAHGAEHVLLDNFTLTHLRTAVQTVRRHYPGVLLEASGGLTLTDAAAVAATGVDSIAVGALTHSAPSLDIGLDFLQSHASLDGYRP